MQAAGFGRVIFWEGGSVWIGISTAPVDAHAHHAIQIGFGLSGSVEFKRDVEEHWTAYPAAFIPSNLPHCFRAPGRRIAMLFCEPESLLGRQLLQRFGTESISEIPEVEGRSIANLLVAAYDGGADDEEIVDLARRALSQLASVSVRPAHTTDPRILRAIGEIAQKLDEPLTLSHVARVAGLSESRFRHLFVAETGVSFRAYVLWARLTRALAMGFGGTSWTEAAHATNFADSAHLTRTCRRMMGITPTSIRQDAPSAEMKATA